MALVIVRHGPEPPLLERQAGLDAVERLDLALLVNREHDGMRGRVDIKPDHVEELRGELGVVGGLELAVAMRLKAVGSPDAPSGRRSSGSHSVRRTTRSATSDPSGLIREGRVLSRSRPSTPSCMKRSCRRQAQVLEVPVWRMISAVPTPSALSSTMAARQTCFWAVFRVRMAASRRCRSQRGRVMEMLVRMA